ncbi:MAG: serine/threonine-protein kinase, partial [Phycisphaerae bacterium]
MADARWEQIKAIFRAALAVDDAERRRRLLDRECGGDDELRREVESLLAANAPGPLATGAALAALDARDSGISTVARAPLIERAGQKNGPYKLLQQIGEGGFGVVFMAEQDVPVRRRVALKVIKLGMDTRQVVARFEQERQALALMDHPHIAKVLDAGATPIADGGGGRPFFVMEYVIGDPITAFADAHKLTIRDRLGLFAQVCAAVQHAHTKGVIHRDLKPRNVLVSMVDGRPHAKVIDFGIAKATGARLTDKTLFTEHRQLIGTPEYMSPEQAEGSPDIDTRTDVYALGVLLYELLTGATPFDARRLRSAAFGEMQRIIKEEEPPMPSVRLMKGTEAQRHEGTEAGDEPGVSSPSPSLRASVPSSFRASFVRGELDWIVMKALDKDRARRYESPSQFAADVQRHLSGEPVVAAPPSMAYRVRKFVR